MTIRSLVMRTIGLYRKYLSPMKMQCCRFYPSCSQYALEAVEKHGVLAGIFMTIKRVLRCHPISKGGYDPVK